MLPMSGPHHTCRGAPVPAVSLRGGGFFRWGRVHDQTLQPTVGHPALADRDLVHLQDLALGFLLPLFSMGFSEPPFF